MALINKRGIDWLELDITIGCNGGGSGWVRGGGGDGGVGLINKGEQVVILGGDKVNEDAKGAMGRGWQWHHKGRG